MVPERNHNSNHHNHGHPNSLLQQAFRAKLAKCPQPDGGTTMVIEDGGLTATRGAKMRDLFRIHQYTFMNPTCLADPKTDCSQQCKVYICTCDGCSEEVITEEVNTGTNRSNQPGGEFRPNYIGIT